MNSFGRTEKILFFSATVMLLAFSYFLYDDSLLFTKNTTDGLERIGSVHSSQNDVRRKNSATFSWLPADNKDQVYQNDSIYTGERSEVTIQLSSGAQIAVRSNSLVNLNIHNDQMHLDLRYGNFVGDIAAGATLKIKSGGDEFELQGGGTNSRVELKKDYNGVVNLKLLSGDVNYIHRKNNARAKLQLNSYMTASTRGLKENIRTTILFTTPQNSSWVRVNPDDPLAFQWQTTGQPQHFEFELSANADFSDVAIVKQTQDKTLSLTEPLPVGNYYYRVKAFEQGQWVATSPVQQMALAQLPGPTITNPAAAALLNFETQNKEVSTTIQWESSPLLKLYSWQISKTEDFTNLVSQSETDQDEAIAAGLVPGKYWVRVQGKTADGKLSPWSQVVNFSVSTTLPRQERLSKPVLLTKEISFSPSSQGRGPASPQKPTMMWKPVLQSNSYQVQIAKDLNFAHAVTLNQKQTQVAWENYRPGKYYYRVFAKDSRGRLGEPSEVGIIDIGLADIQMNQPTTVKSGKADPVPVQVTWSQVPFATSYKVYLAKDKDFTHTLQFSYTTSSGAVTLPEPGQYYVRVQGLAEDNQPVTHFSNVEEISFKHIPSLKPPQLLEPFNNASIFLQKEMAPYLWLEWRKVSDAGSYLVEISDKADFSTVLISKTIKENRFLMKDRVPLGKIYWRVRAISEDKTVNQIENSDWAEKREFTLHHQKKETF